MNVWKEHDTAWENWRRHSVVCPQCRNGAPCTVGSELEAKWTAADKAVGKAEGEADDAAEGDLANEVALPPWLDDIGHDRPWTPEL